MATEPLRYAADITPDDVDAVTDFLMGVLNGPFFKVDTHEYRLTAALRGLVPAFAGSLGYEFRDEVVAKAQEDERKKLSRIQNISTTWNDLAKVASNWKDADGFDTERWQTVRFYDAKDEEEFRLWEEKEKGTAAESAPFVSEYRVPGQRRGGEYVVARDPENANLWAVFEGTAQARHWDGTAWQHARFTGTGPYLFARATALALAHQHAERDVADEDTSR
ncbi:hypothetical protein ACOMD4_37990 [Streptomyces anulatus]|uniref:hypothetical protein n=1 Tax=Streptomyces anulatus TaxID=1892 RepID=UPI003B8203A1